MSFELEVEDLAYEKFELREEDIDDIDKEIEDENCMSGMSQGGLKFNRTFKGGLSGYL